MSGRSLKRAFELCILLYSNLGLRFCWTLLLKGLSGEMEGGIKLASIDRSLFKQLAARHAIFLLKGQYKIYI